MLVPESDTKHIWLMLLLKDVKDIKSVKQPNGQKLRRPEPNVLNNPKAHSQIGSANEGLPPALC
jgi:hypothetical protein